MKYKEFKEQVEKNFPNANIEEDNYGQLVIYTDLCVDEVGDVVDINWELRDHLPL